MEADEPVRQTTEIHPVSHGMSALSATLLSSRVSELRRCALIVITENGVRLRLNIVDTPGYGDQVNNENWYVLLLHALYWVLYL